MGVNLCNLQSDVMPSKKLLEWAYVPIDMKHFPGDWYYFKEAQTLLVDFMNKVWEGRHKIGKDRNQLGVSHILSLIALSQDNEV